MKANFYLSGNDVHDRVILAMYEGCPLIEKRLVNDFKYEPADVGVVFGVRKSKVPLSWPRGDVIRAHRADLSDVLILETGYINRGDGPDNHYAAGFNGLNGRADFCNKGMPGDRAALLGVKLAPWNQPQDGHVVICGQVPWDASVENIDMCAALIDLAKYARGEGRHVIYRPHPLAKTELPGFPLSINERLADDLKGAYACATINSNSAVESVILGTPVVVVDRAGSMAAAVSRDDDPTPPREQWLSDLAYAQWTPAEMRNGEAWKHLYRSLIPT